MTTELGFTFFDCDNHYYEAVDAFTRHIEPQYKKRAIQWAQIDGKQRLVVAGRVNSPSSSMMQPPATVTHRERTPVTLTSPTFCENEV